MAKLAKDSGKYYVIHENGTYTDISEAIEKEIKKRIELELRLFEYNKEIDNNIHFRLATITSQLLSAKKFIRILVDTAHKAFQAWAKAESCHGQMLELKNQADIADKWLEETKQNGNQK